MGISQVPKAIVPASFFSSLTSATSSVATSQSTTSSSFTDLATAGPAVTLTTGTKALVLVTSRVQTASASNSQGWFSYAVSGSTTISASDDTSAQFSNILGSGENFYRSTAADYVTLTAGSNTFTMKYRSGGGTVYFAAREIIVIDLGS